MTAVPVIVISSSAPATGKTTLALNLSAALWSDGYRVRLFAPGNETVREFMLKRAQLAAQCGADLPVPLITDSAEAEADAGGRDVLIAVIKSTENEKYADVFCRAHTLVSAGCAKADFDWSFSHPYINLIWRAKKQAAARGIKYLNWVAVQNKLQSAKDDQREALQPEAKQLGFRFAEPLHLRDSYRYVRDGYTAADMAKFRHIFKMSMEDVYARREILNLAADLWKNGRAETK